jgi:hypothetical protein
MTACASLGPPGDCPCIRREKGLPVPIKEAYCSPEAFDMLTEEEKNIINNLKLTAALRLMQGDRDAT